ncbi:hypothetical protein HIMB100_00012900 [SAR116 cluster alpha proteobacterium HIMB100]|nr:hypothetical protein HIMB100_00012900 [SAR116 cluster alpha proteobacterium HIMB100]
MGWAARDFRSANEKTGSFLKRFRAALKRSESVDLFLSTYENKLDAKGRVSVPAPYRSVLERNRSPLYIYKSLTLPCLEGCGPERISQIVDAIDDMDSLSKEAEVLQTMLFSAQEMKIDSDGRMLLPAEFVEFAELDGVALFAGIGRSFQIWRPDRHQQRELESREQASERGVPRLTLGRRGGQGDR